MSDEKTEEPTDKKLEDAAEKGQHAKSQDVPAAAALLGLTMALSAMAANICDNLREIFETVLGPHMMTSDLAFTEEVALQLSLKALLIVAPLVAASIVIGLVMQMAQTGIQITFEPLGPNFDKLNPADGIKNVFSAKSLIEFAKMVVKAVALGAVSYVVIRDLMPLVAASVYQTPSGVVAASWISVLKLFKAAIVVFIVIAPVDWAIAKWQFIESQKMTKDEVKREHKESEGDPQMKQERKKIAQEMVMNAPKAKVPGASAVVTNPTHYAVAIRYDPQTAPVPLVVCKGLDAEAAEIREVAAQHGVPIVANPPLARALHKVAVDEPIPVELFEAVAAVLRWTLLVERLAPGLGGLDADTGAATGEQR